MAWIKIEKNTPEKPELRVVARQCAVNRPEAFLAFFTAWSYFDDHCSDGFIPGFTKADVDEVSGLRGFADAMATVGWLTFDSTGMQISNWHRHNGQNAKKRALAMSRKQAERSRKQWSNVTHTA